MTDQVVIEGETYRQTASAVYFLVTVVSVFVTSGYQVIAEGARARIDACETSGQLAQESYRPRDCAEQL
jgi:hypothetical protein